MPITARRLAVIRERVAKAAGLGGAARGVVLGIEIEHDLLALELRQRDLAVAVGRQGEIGRLVAGLDTHVALSPPCSAVPARRRGARRRLVDQALVPCRTRAHGGSDIRVERGEVNRAGAARQRSASSAGERVASRRGPRAIKLQAVPARRAQSQRAPAPLGAAAAAPRPRASAAERRARVAAQHLRRSPRASRSIRYWAMNSMSIRPPRRCFKSQGDGRGAPRRCAGACRRHRRRAAAGRAAGVSTAAIVSPSPAASAGRPGDRARAGQRHMLPGPGRFVVIAAEAGEARRDRPRCCPTAAAACRPRRAGPRRSAR